VSLLVDTSMIELRQRSARDRQVLGLQKQKKDAS